MRNDDLTRLSYWYPKLLDAGLPVPKTILVTATRDELKDVYNQLDGIDPCEYGEAFYARLRIAADAMGYPCFLRTDHTSAKHEWKDTCYLPDAQSLFSHVPAIIHHWECTHMAGPMPFVWVVREFLPIIPYGACVGYGDMPINREYRFFVKDAHIQCHHWYWPLGALEDGEAVFNEGVTYESFTSTTDKEIMDMSALASAAGAAVGGAWSVDILETKRGWVLTDMAEADKSWHWPGCPYEGHPDYPENVNLP